MTNEELKEALLFGYPVIDSHDWHGAIEYDCVLEIVYQKGKDGKIDVSAGLSSAPYNSVIYVDPKYVHMKTESESKNEPLQQKK